MAARLNPTVGLWAAAVAGIAALLGLIAAVNPTVAIFGTFGIVFVALAMVDLTAGVVLFTLLVGVIEVIPGLGEISAAKLAAGVLVIAWAGSMVTGAMQRRQLFDAAPGLTLAMVLLVCWAAASGLWADDSGRSLSDAIRLALNMLLVPIVFAAVRGTGDVRWLTAAFVLGVVASGLYGFVVTPGDISDAGRLGGAGLDPNYLAVWLVAGAALSLALVADRGIPGPLRAVALAGAAACVTMNLLTASRTGLIALVVVAVGGAVFAGRGRRLPMILVLAVSLGTGLLYFNAVAPETARERITSAGDGSGRSSIWEVGWRMVEANPVKGVGMGNFQVSSIRYLLEPGAIRRDEFIVTKPKQAHNVYLEVLAELGAVGLALLLAVIGLCVAATLRAARIFQRIGDRSAEVLSRGTLLAILAVLSGCVFVSLQYTKPVWILLALGPIMLTRARAAERELG